MPPLESPPERRPPESKAGKWLKRSAALAGAAAVGYFGALKKEKDAEEVPLPTQPKAVETVAPIRETGTDVALDAVNTHIEMRPIKIADGIEQEHAIEVDEKGNPVRDLGTYHLWKEAQALEKSKSSFRGYGTETRSGGGEVTKTPYVSKNAAKATFSGYGVSTKTDRGEVIETPYGEKKGGKNKFRGNGVEP